MIQRQPSFSNHKSRPMIIKSNLKQKRAPSIEREREREMDSRRQKNMALRRKLQILRSLTSSKSVRKSSIIMDAFNYINQLKLKLETMNQEYGNLINQFQVPMDEVKVEKVENGFLIRVRCEKVRDTLVSILAAFEEAGLNVLHARVSCNHAFCMEAIAEAEDQTLDARDVTQAVFKAIANQGVDR